MTRNIWWLAASVLTLTLVGGARAEEDCCAQQCLKAKIAAKLAAECTCEGKDKADCKCDKCKCEPKPNSKCTCEGKDSEKCVCEKCKCMKKVEKVISLGKHGFMVLRWMVASPSKAVGCTTASVKHNEGAECAEEGCCAGRCPLKTMATKAAPCPGNVLFGIGGNSDAGVCGRMMVQGEKMPYPIVVHGPMPIPTPLFPHPVPPPFGFGPFVMPPVPVPTMVPGAPVRPHAVAATQTMMPCAAAVVEAPVAPAMRFVADAGQVKMEMQHGDSSVASERMKVKVGDHCTVQVFATLNEQVAIRCECMTAKADSVVKTGKGDRLVLEGNVTFKYSKGEQVVEATADRVIVDPSTGRFEIKTAE